MAGRRSGNAERPSRLHGPHGPTWAVWLELAFLGARDYVELAGRGLRLECVEVRALPRTIHRHC
jgi:hypothetical protein